MTNKPNTSTTMSHLKKLSDILDKQSEIVDSALGKTKNTKKINSPLMYKPHGACGTVTGSAHFVHHVYSDKYIAVDCGLLQGEGDMASNAVSQLPIHPKKLHAIFLTHAHTDHVGNMLQWLRAGFRGKIYCTDITANLTLVSLTDSLRHQDREEDDELDKMLELLPTLFECPDRVSNANYGRLYQVEGAPGLLYSFTPTSHLVGCVALRLFTTKFGQKQCDIVFSGDIGPVIDAKTHGGLAPARQYPNSVSGVVVLESTYGDKAPRDPSTLLSKNRLSALAKVIKDSVTKSPDARLIIPAFSLGRTTDILTDLFLVLTTKRNLTGLPKDEIAYINIDSKLSKDYAEELSKAYVAAKASGEYSWLNPDSELVKIGGVEFLERFLSAKTEPYQEYPTPYGNVVINWGAERPEKGLNIYIAGSGTTLHGNVCREIMENAKNPNATVVFCGYSSDKSLGGDLRRILSAKPEDRYDMPPLSFKLSVKKNSSPKYWQEPADAIKINIADLTQFYSGHADSNSLKHYISNIKKLPNSIPLHLILVHGSNAARFNFSNELKTFEGVNEVHCPSSNYPWFDVYNKVWEFPDLGIFRSSMTVFPVDDKGKSPTLSQVTKAVVYTLVKKLGIPKPEILSGENGKSFLITDSLNTFNHKVEILEVKEGEFCIQADTQLGTCQTNDEFKLRCFPWETISRSLDETSDLGYHPVGKDKEALALKNLIYDNDRKFPIITITKLGTDNTCAKFLSKSLLLNNGQVFLVTMLGRNHSRDLGLDVRAGEGVFYDETPGSKPVVFSIINPLDSAHALIKCLNRIEDTRRNTLNKK